MRSNWYFSVVCLLLFFSGIQAQTSITGRIFSAKDSSFVQGASIYFDGTSIGTSSGPNGHFALNLKDHITSDLIISSVGYKSIALQVDSQHKAVRFSVYLKESEESLPTVFLEDDPWSRKKKLAYFKQEFLGAGSAAKSCKILNEDQLELTYSPSSKKLRVYSNEPLIVQNDYLAYKLQYDLLEFEAVYSASEIAVEVYYAGTSFFQDQEKLRKKHLKAREMSYAGSSLHFMRSLKNEELLQNQFQLYSDDRELFIKDVFELKEFPNYTQVLPLVNNIRIRFRQNYWSFLKLESSFIIDDYGNFAPPRALTFGGDMSARRVSTMLPLDYPSN